VHTDTDRLLPASPAASLADHLDAGGGRGSSVPLELGADGVCDVLDAAGLRGRGGAGFPTARKWRGVAETARTGGGADAGRQRRRGRTRHLQGPHADQQQPYALLEGICIALATTGATSAHIGIKEKFTAPVQRLADALEEVRAAGWPHADRIDIVTGPDAYLFGEESAMLEVIEGNLPLPRIVKPFEAGLQATTATANPTVVNNVETLSHVPAILAHGAEWFRAAGTEASPGTMVFTVVGDVASPGVYELALGTPAHAAGGHRRRDGDQGGLQRGLERRDHRGSSTRRCASTRCGTRGPGSARVASSSTTPPARSWTC
jgi:NADH-quinone oxidoreductase subunit F